MASPRLIDSDSGTPASRSIFRLTPCAHDVGGCAFGPIPTAAVAAAAALLNAVMIKGNAMTMDDFNATVVLDNAAIADDLVAQAAATLEASSSAP